MSADFSGSIEIPRRIIALVPHEPGSLNRITQALGDANINIEDIDGRGIGELGVISLRTDDDDAALHAMLEEGIRAVTSDAIVFHLPDRPGALAGVSRIFYEHRINVRTIHIMHRIRGHAIVAVTTDDDETARTLLDRDSLI